ncbi:hypothetical protein AO462_05810 [Oenococcus oeni]|uniref:hypothetical protein n=1 Tax=Oenococcus oeni TaxID=1247 RepID=UPI000277BC95|nr:hypothetical protein [Oenococcus oeni]EJO04670.1 hypothetical protein AWRIB422_1412 [Oenococcus oeni AWRIB422]OIL84067.1 hypothetical protein ATX36_01790 [Oenococcus oeni]OIL91539.1 hypothetical protein ATX42_00415 [Oenococcus oeni]OIL94951.1 hypothetical protein ATX43_00455 [Oenococcus oeni]OIL96545.1 hypothetical protein ATX44_10610 [Oenococcus oeni]
MKSEVVSIMLNGCTTLIWLIPAVGIIKTHKIDDRFFIRQWLFPLQYWLQVLFEKMSGNRRIVVRILQILSPLVTFYLLIPSALFLKLFNESFTKHYAALFFLMYYLFFAAVAYWFQPRSGKVYRTK